MPHAKPEHAERNARIAELWKAGKSLGRIAGALRISRSAVAGHVSRHLDQRGTALARALAIATLAGNKRQDPTGCLHITGDPRIAGWWYCQAKPTPGKCWCAAHDALCHKPAEPLRVGVE